MKKLSLLVALGGLSLHALCQHGVDPNWSAEVVLPTPAATSNVRGFLYSNMAVLSNNKRIVFYSERDRPSKIYYVWSYDGMNWTNPVLFNPAGVVGINSIKLISGQNDNLHIVWNSQLPSGLFYSKMDSALNTVIDSTKIADAPATGGSNNGVYLTIDLQDRIHVMWHNGNVNDTSIITECFYAQSADGGNSFTTPVQLSQTPSRSSAFPRGQYNAYGGDSLAVFWRDYVGTNNWNIQMVVSTDGGLNWSSPTTVNPSSDYQGDPDLVIDPQGRFHLFYHHAPFNNPYWGIRVVYGYSDDLGQTWNPSSNFYANPVSANQRSYLVEGSRYDVARDVLWTFWKEEDLLGLKGGDMMASYSTDRGLTWSSPQYITDHDSTSIGFKAVALMPNGQIAVNYEVPNFPTSGEIRVVYREQLNSVVGLNDDHRESRLSVYPNPATDYITISTDDNSTFKVVEVYDLPGEKLYSMPLKDNLRMDVSGLHSGVYILKITDTGTGQQWIRKIVKK